MKSRGIRKSIGMGRDWKARKGEVGRMKRRGRERLKKI